MQPTADWWRRACAGDAGVVTREEACVGNAPPFGQTYCTTSWVGRLFVKTPVPHEPYVGFAPDLLMKDAETISLKDFGVDGIVRHTAGHTPGSIGVELASQDALVGDLVASGILIGGIAFNGRAIRPPFEDDPQTVAREL